MNFVFRQNGSDSIQVQLRLCTLEKQLRGKKYRSDSTKFNNKIIDYVKSDPTIVCKLIPPLSFLRKTILGGSLFSLSPNPSSSCSMSFLCLSGLSTSRTIKIKLHVRATAMTCRPRPLPSLAPSMIPGRSSN